MRRLKARPRRPRDSFEVLAPYPFLRISEKHMGGKVMPRGNQGWLARRGPLGAVVTYRAGTYGVVIFQVDKSRAGARVVAETGPLFVGKEASAVFREARRLRGLASKIGVKAVQWVALPSRCGRLRWLGGRPVRRARRMRRRTP